MGMYVCTAPTTCVARDGEWNSRGDLNSSSSTHRNTTHIPIHQERKEEVKSVIESIQLTHLAMRPPALLSLLCVSSLHVSLTTPKRHGPHETPNNTETVCQDQSRALNKADFEVNAMQCVMSDSIPNRITHF